jgi:hypothetical protein
MEVQETLQEGKLLRHADGTPINIEYGGSGEYRMSSTGYREETVKPKNFTPMFLSQPAPNSVIEIGSGPDVRHFKLVKAMSGQEKPGSVYAQPINSAEFNKMVKNGSKIVHPDNEPKLPTAA